MSQPQNVLYYGDILGRRLKIAGRALLGLYVLWGLYFLFVFLNVLIDAYAVALPVLGVLAWLLGWRHALAVGVVLIFFAVPMGVFGAFAGVFGAVGSVYVGIVIFAGPPGIIGFVFAAAGLVERRAQRKQAEVPLADATV